MKTALIQIDPPKILAMHNKPTRVKGGDVIGVVPGTAVVSVVQLERPEYDWRTHNCQRGDPVAFADRVLIGWTLERKTDAEIIDAIKQRASEIILERFPQAVQMNMLADSQMISAGIETTKDAKDRIQQYQLAYAWIKAVRNASNDLEAALVADGTLPDFTALEVQP